LIPFLSLSSASLTPRLGATRNEEEEEEEEEGGGGGRRRREEVVSVPISTM